MPELNISQARPRLEGAGEGPMPPPSYEAAIKGVDAEGIRDAWDLMRPKSAVCVEANAAPAAPRSPKLENPLRAPVSARPGAPPLVPGPIESPAAAPYPRVNPSVAVRTKVAPVDVRADACPPVTSQKEKLPFVNALVSSTIGGASLTGLVTLGLRISPSIFGAMVGGVTPVNVFLIGAMLAAIFLPNSVSIGKVISPTPGKVEVKLDGDKKPGGVTKSLAKAYGRLKALCSWASNHPRTAVAAVWLAAAIFVNPIASYAVVKKVLSYLGSLPWKMAAAVKKLQSKAD